MSLEGEWTVKWWSLFSQFHEDCSRLLLLRRWMRGQMWWWMSPVSAANQHYITTTRHYDTRPSVSCYVGRCDMGLIQLVWWCELGWVEIPLSDGQSVLDVSSLKPNMMLRPWHSFLCQTKEAAVCLTHLHTQTDNTLLHTQATLASTSLCTRLLCSVYVHMNSFTGLPIILWLPLLPALKIELH